MDQNGELLLLLSLNTVYYVDSQYGIAFYNDSYFSDRQV